MKKIVIIGNSYAGIGAVEAIREFDKESSIVMISDESSVAYQRQELLDLLESKVKEREIVLRNEDFYRHYAVDLKLDMKVVALNTKKKRVFVKDRQTFDFDVLLIASGSRIELPKIKGAGKEGVVALNGLADVKFILENLAVAHTVIVVGANAVAKRVACAVAERKIEVKLIADFEDGFEGREGVDIIRDHVITEILGEAEVKAVRLSNQKVLGASLVIFCDGRRPSVDFLKEADIDRQEGVTVNEDCSTSIPFIFAAGDVCEFRDKEKSRGWEAAVAEGRIAGGALCRI